MTEQEAQKWLERFEWDDSEETSEALATICEALQEYPEYKVLGTVEELRAKNEKLQGYRNQMSIYAEQHKIILASDVLDMLEELE